MLASDAHATSLAETASGPVVLVVEDDVNMERLVADILKPIAGEVLTVSSSQQALDYLENADVGVVVTDLRMPGVDGIEVLKFAKKCNNLTQVVLITGHATVESAVDALKSGAFDYLRKPFEPDELRHIVQRAFEHYTLSRENLKLRAQKRIYEEDDTLIGRTKAMESIRSLIDACAGYDCSVLVTGETGSGKELVARQIHQLSRRKDKQFIALNCAAIPESIVESELFGYQKGAFTGADRIKAGLFEVAHGGTLFLDEINNAPLPLQAKLLRVLQDGSFYRLGETEPRHVDMRLLVASNRKLPELVRSGVFREDLYYRLKVVEINVPPLREHREDIPLLASYFISKFSSQLEKKIKGMTTAVLGALVRYDWPGNVRELENLIHRMVILTQGEEIDVDTLPEEIKNTRENVGKALDYMSPQSLEEVEAYFIAKTLRETKGNRGLAAEILGIDKSTLWRKIKRYRLAEE